ncbi:T-cell immunomodulatory protein-like [Myotis lucifugus]|uniref:T-cell immunomodulatory protein-like n=1 Tax=Myotis lucifugus TaxID=59463 RepID=UPI000CCC7FF7|nr:T-cell immunomodulatory protein-like [Myotis lucifugus]
MTMLNRTFHDEPLIMDFNGDLIPDVFGVTHEASQPQILLGGNLSWHPALTTKSKMRIPHSHAFIDLTGDFTAADRYREDGAGCELQLQCFCCSPRFSTRTGHRGDRGPGMLLVSSLHLL